MDQHFDTGRESVVAGYARAQGELHRLLSESSIRELKAKSASTKWTNEQLLFHMVFGYMIVRALLPMVRAFSRMPPGASRFFANILDACTRPFDVVNFWGACFGVLFFNRRRMEAQMGRTVRALIRSRDRETSQSLSGQMSFPTRWDRFFKARMTVADLYPYATQHFDFHRTQLSLPLER